MPCLEINKLTILLKEKLKNIPLTKHTGVATTAYKIIVSNKLLKNFNCRR